MLEPLSLVLSPALSPVLLLVSSIFVKGGCNKYSLRLFKLISELLDELLLYLLICCLILLETFCNARPNELFGLNKPFSQT